MLAVQLLWRLNGGNVPAFPEIIVAAIARLTPLEFFGAATENYGSLAKKSLFVAVLLGIVAVGAAGGGWAGRLSRGAGFGRRLVAGGIVALALFLVTNLVILPIGYYGIFAVDSSRTVSILTQLTLTFALYAVAWAVFAELLVGRRGEAASGAISRRLVVGKGLGGILTLVMTGSVGALAWRVINPSGNNVDEAASDAAAEQIAASARGGGDPVNAAAAAQAEGTPEAAAAPTPDVAATFAELDANGHVSPVITSVADFYHVSKNIVDPVVDPSGWSLTIGGMVDREQTYTLDQLNALGTTTKITTLGCISNTLNGDLIGTAEWQGVPLVQLLATAGVQPGVVDLKFHCADDYEDSIPLERAFDPDSMVVVGMNGAPLTDDHGAPARLIIPGIYGMKNVKWVERIDLVDEDFQGYWQTRGWSDPAPFQIWGRIDYPDGDLSPGPVVAAGMASAGDRGVSRVEVSIDDGETWADAMLEPSINPPFTWVRWAFPFEAVSGDHRMKIRATDGEGTVAPEDEQDPLPDGATGWPRRRFYVT